MKTYTRNYSLAFMSHKVKLKHDLRGFGASMKRLMQLHGKDNILIQKLFICNDKIFEINIKIFSKNPFFLKFIVTFIEEKLV